MVSHSGITIDHDILLRLLTPPMRDQRMVGLITDILASGARLYARRDVRSFFGLAPRCSRESPTGLPIGNLTSQWWGNLYLDGLDHFVKRNLKVKGYLRYMDDFVCFADTRGELRRILSQVLDWLWMERRLMLNPKKCHIRPYHRWPKVLQPKRLRSKFSVVKDRGWELGSVPANGRSIFRR